MKNLLLALLQAILELFALATFSAWLAVSAMLVMGA